MGGACGDFDTDGMTPLVALTRPVSASLGQCELTHVARTAIDVDRARAQHEAYCAALRAANCTVIELPRADALPDAVFVEDAAIVLDEIAVLARPGAESRRPEVDGLAAALRDYRTTLHIRAPATLDGGDVLRVGRTLFVGRSQRTNAEAIHQLDELVAPFGYDVVPVTVTGCLHLKTAVTRVADDTLLVNRAWLDVASLQHFRFIDVDEAEPFAANVVRVRDHVLAAAAFPRTAARLAAAGISATTIDVSELARAEGGLTCCSIIFEGRAPDLTA
jgi:dimethylargininase